MAEDIQIASLTRKHPLTGFPFVVRTDQNGKVAYIDRAKDGGEEFDPSQIRELLKAIIALGITEMDVRGLQEALPAVLEGEREPFCFARAEEPVHGEHGRLECTFEENIAEKLWRDDDSVQIDFRRRNEINNVAQDDLLAEVIPPTPHRDGKSVFGQPLVAKRGRPAKIIAGSNVRLSEDQKKAFSEIEGCVKRVKSRISVDKVKFIQGDIDFKCGSITFKGDVVIDGDVKETFSVEAEGSITVSGTVDRADLKAGGDITIDGGLYGKEGIASEAAGNVSFGFAENATIRAGQNIYARGAMVNCDAIAEEKVFLKAVGKGLIGGHVIGTHGVDANSLGNPRIPTKTIVEFGLRPELAQKLRSLKLELLHTEDEERIAGIKQKMLELSGEYEKQMRAKVIARHITYPGVIITCANASYEAHAEINRMVYYKLREKNEILMRAYGPRKSTESNNPPDNANKK